MHVVIKKIDDNEIAVNGKLVYKDSNGNWNCNYLKSIEHEAAVNYIAALENPNVDESTRS